MKLSSVLKVALPVTAVAAAAAAAMVTLIAPGRPVKSQKEPFEGRNFAHRGLHSKDKSIPENSLTAFAAAAAAGYGAELDVRMTADDRLVVFHDEGLSRMCGGGGQLEEKTFHELRKLNLEQTQEKIPLLSEALDALGGQPVIVELKDGSRNKLMCEKTLEIIDSYPGPVCMESFNPIIVGWFRKNAPDILRGQLSCLPAELGSDVSRLEGFALSNLLTNIISRPHFIAYKIGKKPLTAKLCEAMGAMKVAWTSHNTDAEKDNDAVIFEFYRPAAKFK